MSAWIVETVNTVDGLDIVKRPGYRIHNGVTKWALFEDETGNWIKDLKTARDVVAYFKRQGTVIKTPR